MFTRSVAYIALGPSRAVWLSGDEFLMLHTRVSHRKWIFREHPRRPDVCLQRSCATCLLLLCSAVLISGWSEESPSFLPLSVVYLVCRRLYRTADVAAEQLRGHTGTQIPRRPDDRKIGVCCSPASSRVHAVCFVLTPPPPHLLRHRVHTFIRCLFSLLCVPRFLLVPRPPHRTGVSVCRGGPEHARLHLPIAPPQRGDRRIAGEIHRNRPFAADGAFCRKNIP